MKRIQARLRATASPGAAPSLASVTPISGKPRVHRVCVATPAGDSVHTGYCASLIQMVMRTLGKDFPEGLEELSVQLYGSSILPFSRQVLAAFCVEHDFTRLLMIDSDMEFPSDLLLRLLPHTAPIVAANCTSRRPPHRNTAQSAPGIAIATREDSTGTEAVFRAGTGLMWIDVDVFRQLELPWFAFDWLPGPKVFMGEDYYFCAKARAAGIPIVIDHDVSKDIKHLGVFPYNPLLVAAKEEIQAGLLARETGRIEPIQAGEVEPIRAIGG